MHGYPSREEAERATRTQHAHAPRPLYVYKDNTGAWHITAHPEHFKDAYRVRPATDAEA